MYDRDTKYFYLIHGNTDICQVSEFTTDLTDEQALEVIYALSQNLEDDNWTVDVKYKYGCKVIMRDSVPHRSTAVGDMVLVKQGEHEKLYRCEVAGWFLLRNK
jgi:hypothetical protein